MFSFTLLILINVGCGLIALRRLRPALLAISGNQVLVLQSLRNIVNYGQPASEEQNPAYVYSADHLAIASNLFAFTTALILVAVLMPGPRRLGATPLPALPRWTLWLIAIFLAAITLSSRTILTVSRMDPDSVVSSTGYAIRGSGLTSLVYGLVLYELYRRVSVGKLRVIPALGLLFGIFTFTEFLKGQTGIATGFLVCAAIFFVGAESSSNRGRLPRIRTAMLLALLIGAFATFASAIRATRELIPQQGLQALLDPSWIVESLTTTNQTAEGLETAGNGSSYAAHVLEGITLYSRGVTREWRSFSDPLIFTFEPAFLQEPLGLQRPPNAAEEIKRYFISNGGMYTIGELYWNGGFVSLAAGYILILGWAWLCDTRYRKSGIWLALSCQFAPQLVQAVGYGFPQVFRGFFNGFLVIMAFMVLRRVSGRFIRSSAPLRIGAGTPTIGTLTRTVRPTVAMVLY